MYMFIHRIVYRFLYVGRVGFVNSLVTSIIHQLYNQNKVFWWFDLELRVIDWLVRPCRVYHNCLCLSGGHRSQPVTVAPSLCIRKCFGNFSPEVGKRVASAGFDLARTVSENFWRAEIFPYACGYFLLLWMFFFQGCRYGVYLTLCKMNDWKFYFVKKQVKSRRNAIYKPHNYIEIVKEY